jgi:hypothetical protein
MSKAERAVLERLRTSHPLMEVYIQNVAPDEARGWVPPTTTTSSANSSSMTRRRFVRSDNGNRTRRDAAHHLETANLGDAFRRDGGARLAGARSKAIRIHVRPPGVPRRIALSSCSTSGRFATARQGFVGRIWIEDRDYNLVRFNGASRGSEETMSGRAQAEAVVHMDGWRVNVAPGVWVPSYVYSEETDLNSGTRPPGRPRNRSGKPGSRARHGSGDTRLKTPTVPAR